MRSSIPYCDEVWNVVTGCSPCSPGCENCWAAALASGRLKNHSHYRGLAEKGKWLGKARFNGDILEVPRHWKKPRTVFVSSTGGFFHPWLAPGWKFDALEVMSSCRQHRFLLLTKWAEEMEALLTEEGHRIAAHITGDRVWEAGWPLPNVWPGVSVCNQEEADEKVVALLNTPAAHRWVSFEPLLERIHVFALILKRMDWVVIGCESGPHRRPCKMEWVRNIVGQCKDVGVPVFVKQVSIDGRCSRDPAEWPEDVQVQELPWGKEQ